MTNSGLVRLTLYNDGPIQVMGPIEIQTENGLTVITEPEENWLCRCGSSKNKPFCDGSHRTCGFNAKAADIPTLAAPASAGSDGYVALANVADVPTGEAMGAQVDGKPVVLCNVDGEIYCVGGICTHQNASMAGGDLDGETLWCPLHNSGFDVRTGLPNQPPATEPIATYDVKIEAGKVMVAAKPRGA